MSNNEEEAPSFSYRHRTIRRYNYVGFQFEDFELTISGPNAIADNERFIAAINDPGFPEIERSQIVVVDKAAQAAAERPLSPVVRGPSESKDILTSLDKQRIVDSQANQLNKPGQPFKLPGTDPTKK